MNKMEKIKNLEAARVLLISAREIVNKAINKVQELGPSGISSARAEDAVFNATTIVVQMQEKLEKNKKG